MRKNRRDSYLQPNVCLGLVTVDGHILRLQVLGEGGRHVCPLPMVHPAHSTSNILLCPSGANRGISLNYKHKCQI